MTKAPLRGLKSGKGMVCTSHTRTVPIQSQKNWVTPLTAFALVAVASMELGKDPQAVVHAYS